MSKNINSLEQYKIEYAKSIENPEAFWEEKAANFLGIKNGTRYFLGILLSLKLNGLREENLILQKIA